MAKKYVMTGATATQIKKRYAVAGATAIPVKKEYAMVGSTAELVFSSGLELMPPYPPTINFKAKADGYSENHIWFYDNYVHMRASNNRGAMLESKETIDFSQYTKLIATVAFKINWGSAGGYWCLSVDGVRSQYLYRVTTPTEFTIDISNYSTVSVLGIMVAGYTNSEAEIDVYSVRLE